MMVWSFEVGVCGHRDRTAWGKCEERVAVPSQILSFLPNKVLAMYGGPVLFRIRMDGV